MSERRTVIFEAVTVNGRRIVKRDLLGLVGRAPAFADVQAAQQDPASEAADALQALRSGNWVWWEETERYGHMFGVHPGELRNELKRRGVQIWIFGGFGYVRWG